MRIGFHRPFQACLKIVFEYRKTTMRIGFHRPCHQHVPPACTQNLFSHTTACAVSSWFICIQIFIPYLTMSIVFHTPCATGHTRDVTYEDKLLLPVLLGFRKAGGYDPSQPVHLKPWVPPHKHTTQYIPYPRTCLLGASA
jgi:hypothetical protein